MMKMTAKLMLLLLVAGGLSLSACKQDGEKKADEEKAQTEEPTEEEGAAEEEEEAEEEMAEEEEAETEVDRDNYIEAAYQVACVEKEIEDVEQRKTIKTEIYARFGFDEESYSAAAEQLGEDEAVNTAVETRMEKCTKEIAQGFAKAGEEGAEGEEKAEGEKKEAKKKPAKKMPASTGVFNGDLTGGVEKGSLKLRVNDDFSVAGTARVTAEGKTQPIVLRGKVADDKKSVSAEGSSGNAKMSVNGTIKGDSIVGAATGEIYGKSFKSKFNVSK